MWSTTSISTLNKNNQTDIQKKKCFLRNILLKNANKLQNQAASNKRNTLPTLLCKFIYKKKIWGSPNSDDNMHLSEHWLPAGFIYMTRDGTAVRTSRQIQRETSNKIEKDVELYLLSFFYSSRDLYYNH